MKVHDKNVVIYFSIMETYSFVTMSTIWILERDKYQTTTNSLSNTLKGSSQFQGHWDWAECQAKRDTHCYRDWAEHQAKRGNLENTREEPMIANY